MSFWVLLQVLVNLVLLAGVVLAWVKLNRPAKDDPRLSKGLQLLQSKIAVLEDLSDRTETQVSQLTAILENKCREIQEKIAAADREISKIEASVQKSLEVAKIFQDRIPHNEIIERQNTVKYVKAARLAHQGLAVDEIATQVDLTRAEIEFIAKVNREQLQFSVEDLPAWIREEANLSAPTSAAASTIQFHLPRESFNQVAPATSSAAAQSTTQASPSVMAAKPASLPASDQGFVEIDLNRPQPGPAKVAPTTAASPSRNQAPPQQTALTSNGKTVQIRPVQFPRLDSDQDV